MNLLHAIVHHQTFGQGEVIQVSDDFVSVSFPQPHGEKKFQYPAAFSSHLTIEDDSIKSEMAEVLRQSHLQIEAEEQRVGRANRMAQFRADSIEKANKSTKAKKKK